MTETREDPAVMHANRIGAGTADYQESYFRWNGISLHYVEAGAGDLIILYHGFPSFWYSFFDQMEALKDRYRVVAVDGLGAGLSDKPDELAPYKVPALAAQLDALARHLAPDEKFILIGHDWGGALAWSYAQANPDRLRAVIGMSAPSVNVFMELLRTNETQRQTSHYMQIMRQTPPEAVRANPPGEQIWASSYGALIERGDLTAEEGELFRQALLPPDATNGGFNWYRANVPPLDQISDAYFWPEPGTKITVPSLLIWGAEDRAFVPEFIPMMKEEAERIEVVVLPGINHWASMQDPSKSTGAIVKFLERIGPKAPPAGSN